LALVREHGAGRCGFVVIDTEGSPEGGGGPAGPPGGAAIVSISDVLRISGPHVSTIRRVVPEAYIAETFDEAVAAARQTPAIVATLEGDVLRGPHLVSGGAKVESRSILATKREIKELRERVAEGRSELARMADESVRLQRIIAEATAALDALNDAQHRQEMAMVGLQAQADHATGEATRLARKADVIAFERRQAEEERASIEMRYADAEGAIARLLEEQRRAEETLSGAQGRLISARETVDAFGAHASEARAVQAALIERAAAIAAEVARLEDSAREVDMRIGARTSELEQVRARREALLRSIATGTSALDEDIRSLERLRAEVRLADDAATSVRVRVEGQDALIRDARQVLEQVRAHAAELDVARATAESDLGHLAQTCVDTMQASLDQVVNDVEQMEQSGQATPDAAAITADEPDPEAEETDVAGDAAVASTPTSAVMTAEEAIAALKAKIDRLGPVNMMAIEQFDELEQRHAFLTTQRQDLIDSIAQTIAAITRIDETSKKRFGEAFAAIQHNFQETFSTLFGGGRAGLTLLDENDLLESGIDIVASPPGKRLQNVQLLSGGEKALTAIALMFAIFKYKPSPFCLLDEIDAPLDDANVGRFVEMLQGMLDKTQFILITHNRRTMEIANRLYGVTMEEPGVSKLISVQLN
jgi:chromosome segregation protein